MPPPILTEAESKKRVAELRARGCKVEKVKLPSGETAVLKDCPEEEEEEWDYKEFLNAVRGVLGLDPLRANPEEKIRAVSMYRYRGGAAEKRRYGGQGTVTEFWVYFGDDPEPVKVMGHGPTPGQRKTDAIERAMRQRYPLYPNPRSEDEDDIADRLRSIRVLYRQSDTMSLWGVPYKMRPGQQPGDLWRAGNTRGWIWLGSPGWWSRYSDQEISDIKKFLRQHSQSVPQGPEEWDEIMSVQENPRRRGYVPLSPADFTDLLKSIRVLYRQSDTLWGIPYKMRPGQQPGDLWRSGKMRGWIWLGTPRSWSTYSAEEISAIEKFLAQQSVPQRPEEWNEIMPQENPETPWFKVGTLSVVGGVLGALVVIGGAYYFLTRAKKAQAAPKKECASLDSLEKFAKASGHKLYVPPDATKTPMAQWPAPKPAYSSDTHARTYSLVDCEFARWDGAKWVPDEATAAEFATWVKTATEGATRGFVQTPVAGGAFIRDEPFGGPFTTPTFTAPTFRLSDPASAFML